MVGGAAEALAYSKAYHALQQEGRTPNVPGYGVVPKTHGDAPSATPGAEVGRETVSPTVDDGDSGYRVGHDTEANDAEARYQMPDDGQRAAGSPHADDYPSLEVYSHGENAHEGSLEMDLGGRGITVGTWQGRLASRMGLDTEGAREVRQINSILEELRTTREGERLYTYLSSRPEEINIILVDFSHEFNEAD